MLVPLVFVLALHTADKNDAEQQFRQMEMKLANAKTLECAVEGKMEGESKGVKKTGTVKGSLTFAEGNKGHLELEMSGDDGKATKIAAISDGTKRQVTVDGKPQKKENTPKEFSETSRAMLTRAGLLIPFFTVSKGPEDKEAKVDDLFKVSDFKLGKKEKVGDQEAQAIHYTLTMKASKEPLETTLWIDTKTHLPLKREITSKMGGDKFTVTETYAKLKLDEKVDTKKFELPKD